jgi:protein TonB
MKKEKREDSFIKQPYYEGGDKAMAEFIASNLKYPTKSVESKIEGSVYLRYDIDIKGKVIEAKVISGLDRYCNEEAIRVVKLLQFKVPKNPRNLRITFHKNIRIHFKIHEAAQVTDMQDILKDQEDKQANPVQTLTYSFVSAPRPSEKLNNSPTTYTYSITIRQS